MIIKTTPAKYGGMIHGLPRKTRRPLNRKLTETNAEGRKEKKCQRISDDEESISDDIWGALFISLWWLFFGRGSPRQFYCIAMAAVPLF